MKQLPNNMSGQGRNCRVTQERLLVQNLLSWEDKSILSACIKISTMEEYTKQHRTCWLQHGSTTDVSTITSTDVFNNTRPAYGFYNLMPDQPMGCTSSCCLLFQKIFGAVIWLVRSSHAFASTFKKMFSLVSSVVLAIWERTQAELCQYTKE